MSGFLVRSSQEAPQDINSFTILIKSWEHKEAHDKVLTLKAATAHCVDKAQTHANFSEQKQEMGV